MLKHAKLLPVPPHRNRELRHKADGANTGWREEDRETGAGDVINAHATSPCVLSVIWPHAPVLSSDVTSCDC